MENQNSGRKSLAEILAETQRILAEMPYGYSAHFRDLGIEVKYDLDKGEISSIAVPNLADSIIRLNDNLSRLSVVLSEVYEESRKDSERLERYKTAISGLAVLAELVKERG